VHRYALARELVAGRRVLDIACGAGYGSWLMSQTAARVTGVDISEEAVASARAAYRGDNLEFRQGSCSSIPVESASLDFVVSFETIEHHDEHEEMLAEVKRVLRPDGVLLISTPDRRVYSDEPKHSNPFHVKEYYADEFMELIHKHFASAAFYGQRMILGSCIGLISEEPVEAPLAAYHGTLDELQHSHHLPNPMYLIAVAGNQEPLPSLPLSLYSLSDQPERPQRLLPHARSVLKELWRRASLRLGGSRRRRS
jgi:SAM-dependent methyltransferase